MKYHIVFGITMCRFRYPRDVWEKPGQDEADHPKKQYLSRKVPTVLNDGVNFPRDNQ